MRAPPRTSGIVVLPPALRPGDRVALVAPSSSFDANQSGRLERARAWLETRYRVQARDDIFTRAGFLAGSDERRLAELRDAVHDRQLRAILVARGGYGATRVCAEIDWEELRRHPKWIVGFSDVTALHVEARRVGVASMHAANAAWIGDADELARDRWLRALEALHLDPWEDLVVEAGPAHATVRGHAFGGNLALLEACAAAGRLAVPAGSIVFLEDCTERPYRLDRMLTALRVGGHFSKAAAFVIGSFADCPTGPDGVSAEEVVHERLVPLGAPVVSGAPFGHGSRNDPFVVGGAVELAIDHRRATVRFFPH